MAKFVKCPQCGTQIEVPAQPSGQIVKCPNCGKGLKLVAKKPAGGSPAQAAGATGGGSGGSMAGGSSISAMTYLGDPPPLDDLPNLDSNCAVCGRPTDPERLVEDNGKLVCPDCIKGARSRIDREGPVETFEFKGPAPAPARRGSLINITPAFLVGALAALILIACQVYLSLVSKPVGTLTASTLQKSTTPTVVDPDTAPAPPAPGETAPATAPAATQDSGPTTSPTAESPNVAPPTTVAINTQTPPVPTVEPGTGPLNPDQPPAPAPPPATGESILFPPGEHPGAAPPPVPPGPGAAPAAPTAIVTTSTDPLVQGMAKLQARDFKGAVPLLDTARNKYVLRRRPGDKLTPEQQMTLVGLAAANLGTVPPRPDAAKAPLEIVMVDGEKSRSAVLNNAIAILLGARPKPGRTKPEDLGIAIESVRAYLQTVQNDEFAANIYGTLLDRAGGLAGVKKEALQQHHQFLDNYTDQLGREAHPNQLKWGTEWMPKELVEQYRISRDKVGGPAPGAPAPPPPAQLQQALDQARAQAIQMQRQYDQAKASGGDVIGAKNQLDAAYANMARIQMQMEQANAPAPKPKWLEKFEPVLPEGTVTTQ